MKAIYMQLTRDSVGRARLVIGFLTAGDAESFIASQSGNHNWQALWHIERISAYNKFHWIAWTEEELTVHFGTDSLTTGTAADQVVDVVLASDR